MQTFIYSLGLHERGTGNEEGEQRSDLGDISVEDTGIGDER